MANLIKSNPVDKRISATLRYQAYNEALVSANSYLFTIQKDIGKISSKGFLKPTGNDIVIRFNKTAEPDSNVPTMRTFTVPDGMMFQWDKDIGVADIFVPSGGNNLTLEIFAA